MSAFTQKQPLRGENFVHCAHIDRNNDVHHHFFHYSDPIKFEWPDKTVCEASWVILCEGCFQVHASNPLACVSGDDEWNTDEPYVEENLH
jgi:hypothetical protein